MYNSQPNYVAEICIKKKEYKELHSVNVPAHVVNWKLEIHKFSKKKIYVKNCHSSIPFQNIGCCDCTIMSLFY